jgi:hypothetical protein
MAAIVTATARGVIRIWRSTMLLKGLTGSRQLLLLLMPQLQVGVVSCVRVGLMMLQH